MSRRIPNPVLSISVLICKPIQVAIAAAIGPVKRAGKMLLNGNDFCLIRKMDAMTAEGKKNNRLILLAELCSTPRIMVSQRISRLPPPTPKPAKNPSRIPTAMQNQNESSIDIGSLPRESSLPKSGEARLREFAFHIFRPERHQRHCQANREVQPPRELLLVRQLQQD